MPRQTKTSKDKAPKEISLLPDDPNNFKPKLKKLIVKNFRAIGETPVVIDLDDIVILVGANNAGKSSILKAYEIAMNHGSKEAPIDIKDFPNGKIDHEHLPEVEVHTIISENKPGERWIKFENGQMVIRERWIWNTPNDVKRQGFDVIMNEWSDQVPWGAPAVASAYRPKPHRIDAFASPKDQDDEITKMVSDIISDHIKEIQKDSSTEEGRLYQDLMKKIADFQQQVFDLTSSEISEIENSISSYLGQVFLDYVVKIRPTEISEKSYSPFKESFDLFMGPKDGYQSSVLTQGSGARRTLMWSTLKYIKEHDKKVVERPHVLLLDEPEVCLHPNAIRKTREVLYELSHSSNWQVMITTHSPIFIDLSHDNTTIIRVDKNEQGKANSMTLYRPDKAQLSDDDKENLKLLNICDPYVHEFFFGGRVIIVEGDTEYTAFSYLKMIEPEKYEDVHIIRARGKNIIPLLCKILNQFSCSYAVLHDRDTETLKNGSANPAWTINENIMEEVQKSDCKDDIIVIACKQNFEDALFNHSSGKLKNKPYNALSELKCYPNKLRAVQKLFDSLLDASKEPPEKCQRWSNIDELRDHPTSSIFRDHSTDFTPEDQISLFDETPQSF